MIQFKNNRVLAIDDNTAIHADYRKVLATNDDSDLGDIESLLFGDENAEKPTPKTQVAYEIDSAYQGQEGLAMVEQANAEGRPYAVAFVDIRMPPGWDGVETAQRIWEVDPDLPIILCTAYSDHSWEEITNRLDRPDQLLILKKPFDNVELRQLAASQTEKWRLMKIANLKREELESLVAQRTKDFAATRDIMFYTLAKLAESRDAETGNHLDRMQQYTRILAEWLRDNGPYQEQVTDQFVDDIYRSSVLHDLGKVGTPDAVLLKPGRLTPDEFEIMKEHVIIGADALDEAAAMADCCSFLKMSAEIARFHHERFNGTGYPEGRSGFSIPLSARIIAVADVYDALTSDRRYRQAMNKLDVKEMINTESGQHFDPAVVEAFNACWETISCFEVNTEAQNPRFLPVTFPNVDSHYSPTHIQ